MMLDRLFREADARAAKRSAERRQIADDLNAIACIDRILRRSIWTEPVTPTESKVLVFCWACLGATLLAFLYFGV